MPQQHQIAFAPSPKRVRVMANGKTVADSLSTTLLIETGNLPIYYFPRRDVRMDFLQPTRHRTHCPHKGEAFHFNLTVGNRTMETAVWSYEQPLPAAAAIKEALAFYWDRVDHWFEEDEEIFGHPRDPHHRIDVRRSSREVRAFFNGEMIARTRRALFLFETGLPARYYVPPQDLRTELLTPSSKTSICPYKGQASYWSLRVGERMAQDAVWGYPAPLPDCAQITGHYCFYPEKIDLLEVEGGE